MDAQEFVILFVARIVALCVALLVAGFLSWLCVRGIKLLADLWKRIIKDLASKKLTPEKLNLGFVLLFFLWTMYNSVGETVDDVLRLPPRANPVLDDSILLFLLMLGSLMFVFWLALEREKNRKG
jgi:hypothetical protein